ncbi:MAG: cytochrome b/b6 domain-containing protein [Myxococcales bacterium]|nr:cytochrome b/b6 domain-containing protein [Myxococcales bacterium]
MKPVKVYVYPAFERFWHWTQAVLTLFLMLSGFEIHGSFTFFGYEQAVRYHNNAAVALLILIAFAIFWHLTTGEWKQYIPTRTLVMAQVHYYIVGIFRNAPHPTKKTALSKLNPLQKIVYLGLKVLLIPITVLSGLLYMFYRYPQQHQMAALNVDGLELIALTHTLGAFLLVAFLLIHIYLVTTGHTPTSNLKAMITGYEELEVSEPNTRASSDTPEPGIVENPSQT